MKTFAIYFNDLTEKAQQELLELASIETAADANWDMDILPLATIDLEEYPWIR